MQADPLIPANGLDWTKPYPVEAGAVTKTVNVHEAKTHLSRLIERAAAGDEIIIAKAGKPIARLGPIAAKPQLKKFDLLKGQIKVPDDFDAPLDQDALAAYGGDMVMPSGRWPARIPAGAARITAVRFPNSQPGSNPVTGGTMICLNRFATCRTRGLMTMAAASTLFLLSACGSSDPRVGQLEAQVQQLTEKLNATQTSVTRLEDVKAIEKLQRAYGYYVDKALWSQIVDLFAEDGTVQLGGGGLYKGKEGVARQFMMGFGQGMGRGAGKDGLRKGVLFNHPQFQGIVDIDADGTTAHARWRTLAQAAWQERPIAFWNEGVYENEYVKENGVWKFKHMKFWSTYFTNYYEGWDRQKKPALGGERATVKSEKNPYGPDEQTSVEDANSQFPEHYFVPPFHYPNPVSGKPVQSPAPF